VTAKCKPPDEAQGSPPQAPEGTATTPTDVAPQVDHPYDDRGIDALTFLRRVMDDPNTSLRYRMQAADILMRIDPDNDLIEREGPIPTYRIGGIKGYDA
jgi:hypothetical protein